MKLFIYERFSAGNALFRASRDYVVVIAVSRKEADELVNGVNKFFLSHSKRVEVRSYPVEIPAAVHLDGQPYKAI